MSSEENEGEEAMRDRLARGTAVSLHFSACLLLTAAHNNSDDSSDVLTFDPKATGKQKGKETEEEASEENFTGVVWIIVLSVLALILVFLLAVVLCFMYRRMVRAEKARKERKAYIQARAKEASARLREDDDTRSQETGTSMDSKSSVSSKSSTGSRSRVFVHFSEADTVWDPLNPGCMYKLKRPDEDTQKVILFRPKGGGRRLSTFHNAVVRGSRRTSRDIANEYRHRSESARKDWNKGNDDSIEVKLDKYSGGRRMSNVYLHKDKLINEFSGGLFSRDDVSSKYSHESRKQSPIRSCLKQPIISMDDKDGSDFDVKDARGSDVSANEVRESDFILKEERRNTRSRRFSPSSQLGEREFDVWSKAGSDDDDDGDDDLDSSSDSEDETVISAVEQSKWPRRSSPPSLSRTGSGNLSNSSVHTRQGSLSSTSLHTRGHGNSVHTVQGSFSSTSLYTRGQRNFSKNSVYSVQESFSSISLHIRGQVIFAPKLVRAGERHSGISSHSLCIGERRNASNNWLCVEGRGNSSRKLVRTAERQRGTSDNTLFKEDQRNTSTNNLLCIEHGNSSQNSVPTAERHIDGSNQSLCICGQGRALSNKLLVLHTERGQENVSHGLLCTTQQEDFCNRLPYTGKETSCPHKGKSNCNSSTSLTEGPERTSRTENSVVEDVDTI